MLQSLFRRAEAKVDNAITNALMRALVALPFIVAAGFATAALAIYLYENVGPAMGNLLVAGVFVLAGMILAAIVALRQRAESDSSAKPPVDSRAEASAENQGGSTIDPIDREVLGAVATAVGPLALPLILKPIIRNLPLVAAIAAAGFVLTRKGETAPDRSSAAMQPAE